MQLFNASKRADIATWALMNANLETPQTNRNRIATEWQTETSHGGEIAKENCIQLATKQNDSIRHMGVAERLPRSQQPTYRAVIKCLNIIKEKFVIYSLVRLWET